ncbi:universal stress protein [Nonomuraea gerenzanensis]|uniref:Universal stress protein family n=1 Tax=Nonomuraea gerenzanensis TaxID=93944 RepID=A0A1M4EAV4_9ACTN|nr:universal stress protein [Nonomuraea gerenzanensis]UBU18256.1 universal stress protein [Nonomuraea gerenzanensis]SBO96071.1 Universal stress protein family [Nonomuraea gerenzanensis]
MTHIVLGYDGSDFSMQALDWALDEAELRKLPLLVAHAWQWPYGEADEEAKSHLRKAAEHVMWHGADCARQSSAGVRVETDLYEGPAAGRLVELSHGAALIVVGSRGLSALPRAVVGSVAGYVAAHAACPVIVVRGAGPLPATAKPGPVVVPEREPEAPVLRFAFQEAAMRRLALAAHADLTAWAAGHPGVRIQPIAGHPAAGLMVVGRESAARGGAAGQLLQHAPCPVAVVGTVS